MKHSLLKLFGAAALWLLAASQTCAQPIIRERTSVESFVLNADIVVVGRIVEIKEEKEIYKVTLAVEETLRGKHKDRLLVEFEDWWPGQERSYTKEDVAKLQQDGHRLLVTMEDKSRGVRSAIDLDERNLEAIAADLTILRKPDDVLRVAREALRHAPGVKRIDIYNLNVPTLGLYDFVKVPVDERLEKRALEYVRSNSSWVRYVGMRALEHFKSDDNIALMKRLLSDPEWYIPSPGEGPINLGIEEHCYRIRYQAYENLKSWGVKSGEPVTSVKIEKLDAVRSVSLAPSEVWVAALKNLDRFKNLEELDLFDVEHLTDAEIKALAGFKKLNLHLGASVATNAKVTDRSLLAVGTLTNLYNVELAGTGVTDKGLKGLAGQQILKILDLTRTGITDAGLQELAGLKNLVRLTLEGTKVTDAGVARLRKALPNCNITH